MGEPRLTTVPRDLYYHEVAYVRGLERDARRYRRLQILGCAVMDTPELDAGNVSRFTNLDKIVDDDLKARPSRGEAEPL